MDDSSSILSWLTFLPLGGAVVVAAMGRERAPMARMITQAVGGFSLALVCFIALLFDGSSGGMQFVQHLEWIPSLNVYYHLGIDGLGMVMIALTSIVMLMSVFASDGESTTGYYALMLSLQSGLYGAFTALDFFHWFLFWELCLIPAFFLIKLYGGMQRTEAAIQFFVYTMAGSIALLVGFLGLYVATGTLDFVQLAAFASDGKIVEALDAKLIHWTNLSGSTAYMLMAIGVLLGFAVKVPLMPFHTWLPSTYAQAPTAVTMVLTGVMSKLGVYGLLRIFLPIFPDAIRSLLTPLILLSMATVVFAAASALVQKDIKRMFAYSSVNHLGYCLLGIFVVASAAGGETIDRAAILSGVILLTFNHGITAAALFCYIGYLENRSGGKLGIDDFGGLRKITPVFCGLMGVALFASLGLPGLNGFVGEFLIFKGVFGSLAWAAVFALPGVLITAVFSLNLIQKVFSGPLNESCARMRDLSTKERCIVLPATVLMFVLGIFPGLLLQMINPTVLKLMEGLR